MIIKEFTVFKDKPIGEGGFGRVYMAENKEKIPIVC